MSGTAHSYFTGRISMTPSRVARDRMKNNAVPVQIAVCSRISFVVMANSYMRCDLSHLVVVYEMSLAKNLIYITLSQKSQYL